jgi:hypothetical protein
MRLKGYPQELIVPLRFLNLKRELKAEIVEFRDK